MIDRVARRLVHLGGLALIGTAFLVTAETLLRKYVGVSISGVHEITTYVFAGATTLAFGWTTLIRGHVRIDIVRNLLPGRVRAGLDIIAWAAFLIVFLFLTERAISLTIDSFIDGDRSITILRVPLAIPQVFWAFGLAFCCVAALVVGWRAWRDRTTAHLAPGNDLAEEIEQIKASVPERQTSRSEQQT